MPDVIDFSSYHSILCLNGTLPDKSFFDQLPVPIIAADGAANRLNALDVAPNLIIGDLDSVCPHVLNNFSFLKKDDQNSNDYQKVLCYLEEHHLLPAIVVGINGGYLDHILNNINIFMHYNCLLYAPPIKGFVIKESQVVQLTLPLHTKISILGMPNALVSSIGLAWNLQHTHLAFPGATSCFNRTTTTDSCLTVHQGAILVLCYEEVVYDASYPQP